MREQFEQMSLQELSEALRDGLGVLCDKLKEELGYGDFNQITGSLDSRWPELYIINVSNANRCDEINYTEVFRL